MLEIASKMFENVPTAVIASITAGFLRNVAGWLVNSYKDGKIEDYEVKQLLGTIILYFSSIMLLMLGFPVAQAVALSYILDTSTSAIKNRNQIKP